MVMVSRWTAEELRALREAWAATGPCDSAEAFWRSVARAMRTTKSWRRVRSRGNRDKLRSKVMPGTRNSNRWQS